MKLPGKKSLITAAIVAGAVVGCNTDKIKTEAQEELTRTITYNQPEAVHNDGSISFEVVQFLSEQQETGIPQAMIDLLANPETVEWELDILQGQNLPQFIRGKVNSYANQNHAILALRKKQAISEENPEGIVTFFDFTRGPGGPFPPKLIAFSAEKEGFKKPKFFELTNNHELSGDDGIYTPKDIINLKYIE